MGTFRIEVQTVGGHGCERDVKDGGIVRGCKLPGCPDCMAREFVARLKAYGMLFDQLGSYARITHWPGTPQQVVDDLDTGVRKSSF
jgi:hypothetical protein